MPRATVERILEIAARHDLVIISDEVYERIVFERENVSPASIDPDDRVISIFSFSKDYAMTGWRIGYLCASHSLTEKIVHIQESLIACPSWLGQRAAEAALLGPQEIVTLMCDTYRHRRDLAAQLLEDNGMLVARPAGAFYALARIGDTSADTFDFSRELLRAQHVAVAPGETFGPSGAGLVRVSLASQEEAIMTGITRMVRFLSGTKSIPVDQ